MSLSRIWTLEGSRGEGPLIVVARFFLKQERVAGLLSRFAAADLRQDSLHNDFFAMRRLLPGAVFGSSTTRAHLLVDAIDLDESGWS